MIEIDRNVMQNILMVVPFTAWSPLFRTESSRRQFTEWCGRDTEAVALVRDALAEAPMFELDDEENAFVLSVDYADAEALVRELVIAFEDYALEQLFRE